MTTARVQLVSDLHLEFSPFPDGYVRSWADKTKAEILVVAGDSAPLAVGAGNLFDMFLREATVAFKRVVFILGNHEYYGAEAWGDVRGAAGKLVAKHPNVTWLDNSIHEILGVRFLGGTMWYNAITDHRQIPGLWGPHYAENQGFKRLVKNRLDDKTVVVTHHLPSMRCVALEYANDPLNGYFVCDMERDILWRQPIAWMYGHTHRGGIQKFGLTVLVANPRGYPTENPQWDPEAAVLDV